MKNLILTGFMGTGKSTVGRLLAQKMGWTFVDLDERIEAKIGLRIADFFERYGEAAFRDKETECVGEVLQQERQVIATGGGVILRTQNIELLRSGGKVACLTASVDEIIRRTAGDTTRPLLNHPDRQQRIQELLTARQSGYRQADFCLATDGKSAAEVAGEILQLLQKTGWRHGND